MFTTIAVKAGDLLFCEKAFGYSFANLNNTPRPGSSRTTILINPTSSYMKIGTQADLINIIVQILSKNSSLAQNFTDLYHGDHASVPSRGVDGQNVVDT